MGCHRVVLPAVDKDVAGPRAEVRPIMDLKVVVFPAPLRPIIETASCSYTCMEKPLDNVAVAVIGLHVLNFKDLMPLFQDMPP